MTDPPFDPATGRYPRTGRPLLLNDELADRIVQVVAAGNYLKTAAQFCGVSQSTLQAWLARGRAAAAQADAVQEVPQAEEPFLRLLERVTQAETQAEIAAVTHWRRAFGEDWRAARDYLGRKRPDQWAAKTTVAISSDEAERRIEAATLEALTSMGVDTDGMDLGALGDLDSLDGGDPPEEPDEP
jgi:transposase